MEEEFIEKMLQKLGDAVRILRNRKKLTQRDLASLAKLDRSYLQKVESGKNVSVATVLRICLALEVDVIFLFKLAWEVAKDFRKSKIVAVTSTVPQGTVARKEQPSQNERRRKTTPKEGLLRSKKSCGGGQKCYNNTILIRRVPKIEVKQRKTAYTFTKC